MDQPAGFARRHHNLPNQTTLFVGRTRELERLQDWRTATRLLTLAGVGGVGKTRLALELARGQAHLFDDGAWLVELAPIDNPALALPAVASVLEVREQADRPLYDILVAGIGQRQMLLLLDNCEHLIDACAELVNRLLRACPNLWVLATSREPLGIDGETVWRVPGLALPKDASLVEVAGSEAVVLFLDRASARRPDIRVTEENVAAFAQICHGLDGIPLALELAAARVDVLAPSQIAARLNERFELLTGGSRVASPRHRTLRALVEWSYNLLSPAEQSLFRRLAVFAGGWTLEAAEMIAYDGPGSVLDALSRLTARSLVVAEQEGGQMWYRMLETIRAYGLQQLEASGELAAVRQRHADHYLRIIERPRPRWAGAGLRRDLDRLEREHDNLRAVLSWMRDQGQAEAGLRLSSSLWWFWSVRGYLAEGRGWLHTFLLHPSVAEGSLTRARALYGAGFLARLQGEYAAASTLLTEALTTARAIDDDRYAANALTELADVADSQGAYDDAYARLDEALTIRRRMHDHEEIASTLVRLARVSLRRGDRVGTSSALAEGRAIAEGLGAVDLLAACSYYLGELANESHDAVAAGRHYRESLGLFQELGYQRWIARVLEALAGLEAALAPERALRLAGAAARLRDASGQPLSPSERERLGGRLEPALRALGREPADGWHDGPAISLDEAVAEALTPPEVQVSPAAPDSAAPDSAAPATGGLARLTRREREVIELIARGYSNLQISSELVVTRRTVEAHVTAILNKLGLSTRTQVAVWAIEHGLRVG